MKTYELRSPEDIAALTEEWGLHHFYWLPVAFTHFHYPLCLCDLSFHLRDEHLELLLTLLAGVGVDIA